MATNNKPANRLRCGNIKATIWQNVSEKGPFFAQVFPASVPLFTHEPRQQKSSP
jgi:hypothetical protein